jgi:hypothetical protein
VFGLYLDVSRREPLGGRCNRRDISRQGEIKSKPVQAATCGTTIHSLTRIGLLYAEKQAKREDGQFLILPSKYWRRPVPFPALRLTRYRMTKIQIFREIQDGSAILGFYSDVTVSEPPGSHCNWRAKSRTGVLFGLYLDVSHREPLGGHCNRRDISRRGIALWMMALPYSAFTRMSR